MAGVGLVGVKRSAMFLNARSSSSGFNHLKSNPDPFGNEQELMARRGFSFGFPSVLAVPPALGSPANSRVTGKANPYAEEPGPASPVIATSVLCGSYRLGTPPGRSLFLNPLRTSFSNSNRVALCQQSFLSSKLMNCFFRR